MRQVLLISNERAGSVSDRAREVIVKALQADFKIDVAQTNHRDHATELGQDAVDRGFDAVVTFGGDGTVNETAQGLVATDVALGIIPGGTTNVMARTLGIPRDPVEATAFVAHRLRSQSTRRIGVGRVNARYFLFCAGIGLDAEVVRRMEADAQRRREGAEWRYLRHALKTAFTQYRGANPEIVVEVDGTEPYRALVCVCCNARPFTYFKSLPVDACPQANLDERLDMFALDRVSTLTIPRIAWGLLVSRGHIRWKHARYHHDVPGASWRASRPMPVQVDGDYIGEWDRVVVRAVPEALSILA